MSQGTTNPMCSATHLPPGLETSRTHRLHPLVSFPPTLILISGASHRSCIISKGILTGLISLIVLVSPSPSTAWPMCMYACDIPLDAALLPIPRNRARPAKAGMLLAALSPSFSVFFYFKAECYGGVEDQTLSGNLAVKTSLVSA